MAARAPLAPPERPHTGAKLQIRHVTKTFAAPEGGEEVVALHNVSIDAGGGEFICLLGPSGCGKTTLLNLVAGFLEPTNGEVLVDRQPITGPGYDRGVVFQDYALFPWLTVRENVEFGPRVLGLPKGERAAVADQYLALVGLADFARRYPHELSGGMKQRVGIARALANHPSILLMDEPFGALDAMTRETMQDELLALTSQDPKLVVFVTHSVLEAVFLADRTIVMSARPGRVIADIRIDLPHPRDRTAPDLTAHVRDIRAMLTPQLRSGGHE
ncbi:MAG: ABC transporter ATP-binding protein [Chloroflexi bacterium]|nr:ABC transporter ATP-binding protein [Chloroflexota bacterium]MBI4506785.1 ABC transporter ATP-binding protein [Chloroflexota bacterium]